MSVAAVMLVKDEADIIEATVRHLLSQVDEVYVLDNGSTDGTREILEALPIDLTDDPDPAYYQAEKTTALALRALSAGLAWVVPCDADEIWYAPDGRALRDWLAGVAPDVQIVKAQIYNHLPTAVDDVRLVNPVERIGWRQREPQAAGKVACRLRPDLWIEQGNHSARTNGTALTIPGLELRHFSWRTRDQYLRKIRNGSAAYASTALPAEVGFHWRMFDGATDDEIRAHFRTWFYSAHPHADSTLVYDPAPRRS